MKKTLAVLLFALLVLPIPTFAEENIDATQQTVESSSIQSTESSTQSSASDSTSDSTDIFQTTDEDDTTDLIDDTSINEKNEVVDFVEKQLGVSNANRSNLSGMTAAELKQLVKEHGGGILSEEFLDSLTDQELLNARDLFERYSTDTYGLDMGHFSEVLKLLYLDKTMSFDGIYSQLSFNPNDFSTFSEMVGSVDELQSYLKTLYAPGTFFPVKEMTNEELIAILNYLQPIEDAVKANDGTLWPGRIAWISKYAAEGIPQDTSGTSSTTLEESETVTTKTSSEETVLSESKEVEKKDNLPLTGEQRTLLFSVIGGLLLVFVVVVIYRRRQKSK